MKRKLWIPVALALLLQAVCSAATCETGTGVRRAKAAVKAAEQRVEEAQKAVTEAEQCVEQAEQRAGEARKAVTEAEQRVEQAEQLVGEAQKAVRDTEQRVEQAQKDAGLAQQAVDRTQEAFEVSERAVSSAQSGCDNAMAAQKALAANAEAAVLDVKNDAKAKLDAAQQEKDRLETALQDAKKAEDSAKDAYSDAEETLRDSQMAADSATIAFNSAGAALSSAQDHEAQMKSDLEAALADYQYAEEVLSFAEEEWRQNRLDDDTLSDVKQALATADAEYMFAESLWENAALKTRQAKDAYDDAQSALSAALKAEDDAAAAADAARIAQQKASAQRERLEKEQLPKAEKDLTNAEEYAQAASGLTAEMALKGEIRDDRFSSLNMKDQADAAAKAVADAQQDLDDATEAKTAAEEDLAQAKAAKEAAAEELAAAEEALTRTKAAQEPAEKELAAAEELLTQARAEQKAAEKELDEAKKALEKAKEELSAAEKDLADKEEQLKKARIARAKSRQPEIITDGLLRGADGTFLPYTVTVTGAEGAKIVTVTPMLQDGITSQIGLYLSPDDAADKVEQGIAALALRCGDAELTVKLSATDAANYPDAETIDYYVFALAPAEDGLLVTVETVCGDERISAGSVDGVTLRIGNNETAISGSGVYVL